MQLLYALLPLQRVSVRRCQPFTGLVGTHFFVMRSKGLSAPTSWDAECGRKISSHRFEPLEYETTWQRVRGQWISHLNEEVEFPNGQCLRAYVVEKKMRIAWDCLSLMDTASERVYPVLKIEEPWIWMQKLIEALYEKKKLFHLFLILTKLHSGSLDIQNHSSRAQLFYFTRTYL